MIRDPEGAPEGIFFERFPSWSQIVFGSPITIAVLASFTLNLLFNHFGARPVAEAGRPGAVQEMAVVEGAS